MYAIHMKKKQGSTGPALAGSITEKSGGPLGSGEGDEYKIRIMRAGQGSSAFYPNEMLTRDLPKAFPVGTRMRANHDGWLTDNGGDITRLMAKTIDTPWAEGDEHFTHIRVSEEWSPWVREFGDVIGVSISAHGSMSEQEIDGEIKRVCVELFSAEASPYNTIDFVEAPGAHGRIIAAKEAASKIIEGAVKISEAGSIVSAKGKTSEAAPSQKTEEREIDMTPEEFRAAFDEGISRALPSIVQSVTEAAQPTPPAPAEVSPADIAEALVSAGLTESGRRAAIASINAGIAVEAAVASEVSREKEIKDALEAAGVGAPAGVASFDEADGGLDIEKLAVS